MNKVRVKRRWRTLWRNVVCGCLMLPSGNAKAQAAHSNAPAPNCQGENGAVTPFQAPGQPWQIGISQLTLAASTEFVDPDISEQFPPGPSTASDQSPTPGNVDVVVVDDFNFIPMEVQVSGMQTRTVNLSHGHLVIAHLRALLEKADYSLMSSTRPDSLSYRSDFGKGPRVITLLRKDVMSVNPSDRSSVIFPFGLPSLLNPPGANLGSLTEPVQNPIGSPNFNLQPSQVSSVTSTFPNPIPTPGNPGPFTVPSPIPSVSNPFPIPGNSLPGQVPGPVRPSGGFPRISIPEVIIPPRNLELSLDEYFSRPINFTSPGRPGFVPTSPFIPPTESNKFPIQPVGTRAPDIILNMSLSVFNCAMLEEFGKHLKDNNGVGTLSSFVTYYAKKTKSSEEEVMGLLTYVPANSPFNEFLNERMAKRINPRIHTLAVAASGNYGLNYSTSPGSLTNVISVGARTADWKQPFSLFTSKYWSDRADVLAVGVGFTLSRDQLQRYCNEGETCIADNIKPGGELPSMYEKFNYSGTSFAAPSVSAFLATRIGDNPCFNEAEPFGFRPLLKTKSQKFEFRGDWIYQPCDSENLIPPLKAVPKIP